MFHACPDLTAARDCRDAVATIELEQKPHAALLEARERLARRGVFWGTWMTSDHSLPRPLEMRRSPGDFAPPSDTIKVMTMKVSKGLEFPVVALSGVGHMPAKGEDAQEASLVFYVAATRATHRLVVGVGGDGGFREKLG